MESQFGGGPKGDFKDAVFDHLRGGAHQAEGVRVVGARVAGNVDDAEQLAARLDQGCRRAGQKTVMAQIVFGAVDDDGLGFEQSGADGVGAPKILGPAGAGFERDLGGAAAEIGVAQGIQQKAVFVGEQQQAAGIPDLAINIVDDRAGLGDERGAAVGGFAQFGGGIVRAVDAVAFRRQAGLAAALPGAADFLAAGEVLAGRVGRQAMMGYG